MKVTFFKKYDSCKKKRKKGLYGQKIFGTTVPLGTRTEGAMVAVRVRSDPLQQLQEIIILVFSNVYI
jgi:hypothetical protein